MVGWPPSTLVVSEVQTGGASASDEFVEVANQGAAPVDLLGLEVVYATSSGSHGDAKGHVGGVARSSTRASGSCSRTRVGVHAAVADVTYSGGFAATGGAIALRVVGGSVDRRRRVGRRDECVRRGAVAAGAGRRFQPRAGAGWRGRERRPTRTRTPRLVRPGRAVAAGPGGSGRAGAGRADADARRHADADADRLPTASDADTDRDTDARPPTPTRLLRRLPARRPTPTPDRDADAHADPDADADPDGHADPHPAAPTPTPTPTPTPVATPIAVARGARRRRRP